MTKAAGKNAPDNTQAKERKSSIKTKPGPIEYVCLDLSLKRRLGWRCGRRATAYLGITPCGGLCGARATALNAGWYSARQRRDIAIS